MQVPVLEGSPRQYSRNYPLSCSVTNLHMLSNYFGLFGWVVIIPNIQFFFNFFHAILFHARHCTCCTTAVTITSEIAGASLATFIAEVTLTPLVSFSSLHLTFSHNCWHCLNVAHFSFKKVIWNEDSIIIITVMC